MLAKSVDQEETTAMKLEYRLRRVRPFWTGAFIWSVVGGSLGYVLSFLYLLAMQKAFVGVVDTQAYLVIAYLSLGYVGIPSGLVGLTLGGIQAEVNWQTRKRYVCAVQMVILNGFIGTALMLPVILVLPHTVPELAAILEDECAFLAFYWTVLVAYGFACGAVTGSELWKRMAGKA